MRFLYDLVVLVADADAEWALRTLLEKRSDAMQIRSLNSRVIRDPGRDSGVYLRAQDLLRPYVRQAAYALALLDHEGSGQEHRKTASEMETDMEKRLMQNGWIDIEGHSRVVAIVLDPELEVWVWSRSVHVSAAMGLSDAQLSAAIQHFPRLPNGKPARPKEAMLAALRAGKKPLFPRYIQGIGAKSQFTDA